MLKLFWPFQTWGENWFAPVLFICFMNFFNFLFITAKSFFETMSWNQFSLVEHSWEDRLMDFFKMGVKLSISFQRGCNTFHWPPPLICQQNPLLGRAEVTWQKISAAAQQFGNFFTKKNSATAICGGLLPHLSSAEVKPGVSCVLSMDQEPLIKFPWKYSSLYVLWFYWSGPHRRSNYTVCGPQTKMSLTPLLWDVTTTIIWSLTQSDACWKSGYLICCCFSSDLQGATFPHIVGKIMSLVSDGGWCEVFLSRSERCINWIVYMNYFCRLRFCVSFTSWTTFISRTGLITWVDILSMSVSDFILSLKYWSVCRFLMRWFKCCVWKLCVHVNTLTMSNIIIFIDHMFYSFFYHLDCRGLNELFIFKCLYTCIYRMKIKKAFFFW